jgi:hypothetical protein
MVTCSPTTSSASMTGRGFWTAIDTARSLADTSQAAQVAIHLV